MQSKVKKTLFSTYCTLLFLYVLPFWNPLIFTKLIVLRSDACSDWPAIQCVVIGRIPQVWDGNVKQLNNKTHYKRGICCIQWRHNYWLYHIFVCIFIPYFYALRHVNITMSAFVIGETTNNKHYLTQLKTHVWIVNGKFFKYENILTGCVSEEPYCPYKVGIAPLYRNSLWA